MRTGRFGRKTNETDISVEIRIEGTGKYDIATGLPFFDHMLQSFARHSGTDLVVRASGDLAVGPHHLIEDTGIVIGRTLKEVIGDGRGICRFGHSLIPMDDALATVAIDCGGRPYLVFSASFSPLIEGQIPGTVISHFFESLCANAGITAHVKGEGNCDHHKCEAIFKAFGRALADALSVDGKDEVPSTKGVI